MRAARLQAPGRFTLVEEPDPVAGPGSSLVRVTAVGLCGSDLHWYAEGGIGDAQLDRPLVLGHEIAGVVAVGPRAGQRVAVDPALPCGRCEICLEGHRNLCPHVRFAGHSDTDGGLRELLAWPDSHLHPLPDSVGDAAGAVLEPLGVAVHAMDLGHVRLAGSVAVIGCGPIGLLLVQAARAAGATTVVAVEPLAHRRVAAARCGADLVVGPDDPDLASAGADVVFEVVGSEPAVGLAVRAARPGGRVVLVGIPDDDRTAFPGAAARRKGLTLAVVRRMKDVYPRALRLVERGVIDVDALVTHRYPLDEVDAAFRSAAAREGLKTVVQPAG